MKKNTQQDSRNLVNIRQRYLRTEADVNTTQKITQFRTTIPQTLTTLNRSTVTKTVEVNITEY